MDWIKLFENSFVRHTVNAVLVRRENQTVNAVCIWKNRMENAHTRWEKKVFLCQKEQ